MSRSITLAETAVTSLQDLEFFKTQFIGNNEAAKLIDDLLLRSVSAISLDPARYRFNGILADKGIRIREWLDTDNEYRCFYDDGDPCRVVILLYASMKEDFESALYRHNVIYSTG
jgi:hypothetical protein